MSKQTYEFTVKVTSDPKVSNSFAAALTNGTPDPMGVAMADLEEAFAQYGGTTVKVKKKP